jgi:legumain
MMCVYFQCPINLFPIKFRYDDIANNTNNPYSGKIFNRPNGSEVYTNVKIDYREEDVNVHNFFAILKGEKGGQFTQKIAFSFYMK